MGMAVGGNKGCDLPEPNIVPLIDVLLVLIIIFMVITPTVPQGLDTLVPQPSPPNAQENKIFSWPKQSWFKFFREWKSDDQSGRYHLG